MACLLWTMRASMLAFNPCDHKQQHHADTRRPPLCLGNETNLVHACAQMYDPATCRPHMMIFTMCHVARGQEFLLDYGDVRLLLPSGKPYCISSGSAVLHGAPHWAALPCDFSDVLHDRRGLTDAGLHACRPTGIIL